MQELGVDTSDTDLDQGVYEEYQGTTAVKMLNAEDDADLVTDAFSYMFYF